MSTKKSVAAVGRPLDYLVGWLFRPYVNVSRAPFRSPAKLAGPGVLPSAFALACFGLPLKTRVHAATYKWAN